MAERIQSAEGLPDQLTLSAFAALVLIGGSNVVAVSMSNENLPPFFGAAVRFGAAALILLAVMVIRRVPLPRGRGLIGTVLYGVIGFAGFYALAYWALNTELPASVFAVILATVPLLTFFFALAHGLEPFGWRALVGALIAIGGIAILIGGELTLALPTAALLAAVGAAVCGAEAGVVIKQLPPNHPIAANALGMGIGAALLFVVSVVAGEDWRAPGRAFDWGVLVYLVVLGSVALFGLFLFVLKRWTASGTSYFTVLMPIVSALLGVWLLDEPITAAVVIGGAVILAGVYVGALSQGKVAVPAEDEQEALAQECCAS